MSDTRTIYQAIEEAILEYTDGTGRIYSEQEEGLWNIADRTAAALAAAPTIIRTVAELEALDPDTVVHSPKRDDPVFVGDFLSDIRYDQDYADDLPAVVVTPAAQVRAARKALEEA